VKFERIFLGLVVLLLAWMGWRLMGEEAPRFRLRGPVGGELPAVAVGPEDPVVQLPAEGAARDVFLVPREDEPLPPLTVPPPPMDELAVLLPPPWVDPGPARWSAHLWRPRPTLDPPSTTTDAGDADADAATEEGGAAAEPAPAAAESADSVEEDWKRLYDWVRTDPLTVFWGHVLGDDRWDLQVGDPIRFQEVDPKTGAPRFAERVFQPDGYEDFGFAETLRNRIELEVRAWRRKASPARIPELRDFVRRLLEDGLQEPVAFDYAEELALAATRLVPDDLGNWMLLGEVWERRFRLDRAFALYAHLVGETLPEGAATGVLPADLAVPFGRFRGRAAPRVRMSHVLREFGLDDLAGSLLDAARLDEATDPSLQLESGKLALEQGDVEAALAAFEQARRGFSGGGDLAASLEAGYWLGRAQLAAGDERRAATTFAEVASAAPKHLRVAVLARAGQSSALYLAGAFQDARVLAEDHVEEMGGDPVLLYQRGLTRLATGASGDEVRLDLRAAAEAMPLDAAPALAALAFAASAWGDEAEAADRLGAARERDPSLPWARWYEARRALDAGDLERAGTGLAAFAREYPDTAAALADLGWLHHLRGDDAQAAVALQLAETRADLADVAVGGVEARVRADLLMRRALVLRSLGLFDAALELLDRAVALDPELRAAQNLRAAVLYASGDLDAAVAEYSLLLDALRDREDDPQAVHARTWMERIQEHARLRRWTDRFDGRRLKSGWDTQTLARLGVEPRLEDGRLVLRGRHREAGETRAFRSVPALAFRSAELDVVAGPDHLGDAGAVLSLRNRNRESWAFRVWRDRDGRLRWETRRGGREESGTLERRVPAGEPFRVAFRVDREGPQPRLTVWVDGEPIYSEEVNHLRNPAGRMAIGGFVRTPNALAVDAAIDDVEIVYAREQP